MDQPQTMRPPVSPPATGRPSGSRSFSLRSDKSNGSNKPVESPREKERRDSIWKLDSKANPNAAMTEAQPGEINLLEKATIEPLRNYQHRDARGNVITDPDLSNPTRPRMERPLDTIRSFEKAIDSGYKRRTMMRGESDQGSSQYASRRSSYIGGYSNNDQSRQSQVGGYYGSGRSQYQDGPPNGYASPQQRMRQQRMQSDSAIARQSGAGGVYPQHGHTQSHDTVMTGGTNGSDSTGPWANSTDPSSENSSVERAPNGVPNMIMEEQNGVYRPGGYIPYDNSQQRKPIPLGDVAPPVPTKGLPQTPRPEQEKKKSWLGRRFSKRG